jgi:hypothetical protein
MLLIFIELNIKKRGMYQAMELFEEETELYNSKIRLLNWLYEEIKLQPENMKDMLNEQGQKLPYNI